MAIRRWYVEVAGRQHEVELNHSYWGGRRVIWVDRHMIHKSRRLLDFGSTHEIQIGAQTGTVHIKTNGITFNYDLTVGGHSMNTGDEVVKEEPAPWWAWIFVVACAALILVGGALGALIGVGGGVLCHKISRREDLSLGVRILLSLGITVGTWLIAVLAGAAVMGLFLVLFPDFAP